MALPEIHDPARYALFFDFDGTLADIAEKPDEVQVSDDTRRMLGALRTALHGAVAVISGREIHSVDQFLTPVQLAVSGVHGLTRRDVGGNMHAYAFDGDALQAVATRLAPFLAAHSDLLLERKAGAIALHYRQRPELEDDSRSAMREAVSGLNGFRLRPGKMVIEALAHDSNKGSAIASFLAEPPFLGRIPVFAGDDVTDEDGFDLVNSRQGISIKVGLGDTKAQYRVKNTQELLSWLRNVLEKLEVERERS